MAVAKHNRVADAHSSNLVLKRPHSLAESIKRLEIVLAVVTVAATALEMKGAEVDVEAAITLRRCAADPLSMEIERIVAFIGA